MTLQAQHFYLGILLLVAVSNLSQEHFIPEGHHGLHKVQETLKTIADQINSTVRTGFNSLFMPIVFPAITSTTTTTEEPATEEFDIGFRQIIDAPPRCPPNNNYIRGRCRFIIP